MNKKQIYLASSWRNPYQMDVLNTLRLYLDVEIYDFKHPADDVSGFSWKEIDNGYEHWTTDEYIAILNHPISERGFNYDYDAMKNSDGCVLLLPCGRSAHIEAGYFVGANKPLWIFIPDDRTEPELMYKMANGIYHSMIDIMNDIRKEFSI